MTEKQDAAKLVGGDLPANDDHVPLFDDANDYGALDPAGDHSFIWNRFYMSSITGAPITDPTPVNGGAPITDLGFAFSRLAGGENLRPAPTFFQDETGELPQDHRFTDPALKALNDGLVSTADGMTKEQIENLKSAPQWEPGTITNGDLASVGSQTIPGITKLMIPGWSHDGGGGDGITVGNALMLTPGQSQAHNSVYVPEGAAAVTISVKRASGLSGYSFAPVQIEAWLGSQVLGVRTVSQAPGDPPTTLSYAIPASLQGESAAISLRVTGPTTAVGVLVDNLALAGDFQDRVVVSGRTDELIGINVGGAAGAVAGTVYQRPVFSAASGITTTADHRGDWTLYQDGQAIGKLLFPTGEGQTFEETGKMYFAAAVGDGLAADTYSTSHGFQGGMVFGVESTAANGTVKTWQVSLNVMPGSVQATPGAVSAGAGQVDVARVQQRLNFLGFTAADGTVLDVDGMLGPLTQSALQKMQAMVVAGALPGNGLLGSAATFQVTIGTGAAVPVTVAAGVSNESAAQLVARINVAIQGLAGLVQNPGDPVAKRVPKVQAMLLDGQLVFVTNSVAVGQTLTVSAGAASTAATVLGIALAGSTGTTGIPVTGMIDEATAARLTDPLKDPLGMLRPGDLVKLQDGVSALKEWLARLSEYEQLAQGVPILSRLLSSAESAVGVESGQLATSLGKLLDCDRQLNEFLSKTIGGIVDAAKSASLAVADLRTFLYGTNGLGTAVYPDATHGGTTVGSSLVSKPVPDLALVASQDMLTIPLRLEGHTLADLPVYLTDAFDKLGFAFDSQVLMRANAGFTLDIVLRIDRKALSPADGITIEIKNFNVDLTAGVADLDAQARLGMLGVAVANGDLTVHVAADIHSNVAGTKLTLADLASKPLGDLVDVGISTSSVAGSMPLKVSAGILDAAGVDLSAQVGGRITIADNNLFDDSPPDVQLIAEPGGAALRLGDFGQIRMEDLAAALDDIGNWAGGFGTLASAGNALALTSADALSGLVDFGAVFADEIGSFLRDSQGALQFSTLQALNAHLAQQNGAIKAVRFEGGKLLLDIDLSRTVVNQTLALDLSKLSGKFQAGFKLAADGSTLLADLNGGRGVTRVAGNPAFGGNDFRITARSGAHWDLSLNGITTLAQLRTLIGTATGGAVVMEFDVANERLLLRDKTIDSGELLVTPLNGSSAVLSGSGLGLIRMDANGDGAPEGASVRKEGGQQVLLGSRLGLNPAMQVNGRLGMQATVGFDLNRLGAGFALALNTSLSALNGGDGIRRFTGTAVASGSDFIIRDRSGGSYSISLDGVTTVSGLAAAIQTATGGKVTLDIDATEKRLLLRDHTAGTGELLVTPVNGSFASLADVGLGLLRVVAGDGSISGAGVSADGSVLIGATVHGDQLGDHVFMKDAKFSADLVMAAENFNAIARFGFVDLGVTGADGRADVHFGIQQDPGDTLTLSGLVSGLGAGNAPGLLTHFTTPDVTGSAHFDLPVAVRGNLGSLSLGAQAAVTLDLADITKPGLAGRRFFFR